MAAKGKLYSQQQKDITIVSFMDTPILDDSNIGDLGAELIDIVEKRDKPKLVLSFGQIEYLSSAVLGKLVALHKKVMQLNGEMKFTDVRPSIMEVFKVTKLDKLFSIHDSEKDAISAFGKKRFLGRFK